jgi:hypothetical protein
VYGIRHGLELWLKGVVHTQRVAEAWMSMRQEDADFASVAAAAKLSTKQERVTLRRALCAMRNILQDKVVYPDCFRVRQEEVWVVRAIELVRSGGADRLHLTTIWAPCFSDHELMALWREAKGTLQMFHRAACIRAEQVGIGQPISIERLEAACELFAAVDPEGVAMRYPAAVTGEWHTQKLTVSLKQLGRLAKQLDDTALAFEDSDELSAYDF